jgi:hypothetical protein
MVLFEAEKDMSGGPTQSDHHTAMLEAAIGVQETGPDGTDLWPAGLCAQGIQPPGLLRLDVVIEKAKDVS